MSDSSFKRNTSPQNQPTLREFTVGAPEPEYDDVSQLAAQEAAIKQARQEKVDGPRISEGGKKRIELLAGIGRLTKDIEIGESVFSLRTLKSKETQEATFATYSVGTQLEMSFEARKQQLARAIYKIDGASVAEVVGSTDLSAMFYAIEQWEEILVNKLWDEFVLLKEEARVKYGMSTIAEVKEVIEDLKK